MSTALAALAAAVLTVAAVVFVAWPFMSAEREPADSELSETDRRRLAAAERRDESYQALRDLEQDFRTGKVTEDDHRLERDRLRAEAGAALRELDELERVDSESQQNRFEED